MKQGLKEETPDPLREVISGIVFGSARFWQEAKARFQKIKRDQEIPTLRQVHQKTDLEAIVETVAKF